MYLCARSINIASFYEVFTGFWKCSNSVVIFAFHFNTNLDKKLMGEECEVAYTN
jgi:hypothetical protein